MKRFFTLSMLLVLLSTSVHVSGQSQPSSGWTNYEWDLISDGTGWQPRAGLQVVNLNNTLYLLGGRTPRPPSFPPIIGDSDIWGDVWRSEDLGRTWDKILETDDDTHWPARAYFEALVFKGSMYVLGGQNFKVVPNPDCPPPFIDCLPFLPASDFFSDVWRSRDGVSWTEMTNDAGWAARAGLSAVVFKNAMYVLGGSQQDDDAVGGQERIYFNDVWKSKNGRDWEQLTEDAPWTPRAGARVVTKNGYIYLLGGEAGFFCAPPPCDPPYFNDVWRSRDGVNWELVIEEADWTARPGHQAVVLDNQIVLFGGFGLSTDPTDPFGSDNPMDMWVSRDGADWELISDSPWNAQTSDAIKYDFDALVLAGGGNGQRPAIFTFGGDREDFDFTDPFNYLNVDSDVWRFAIPRRGAGSFAQVDHPDSFTGHEFGFDLRASPNPFNPTTTLGYVLDVADRVVLSIHDISGRHVRDLVNGPMPAGRHAVQWDGRDARGTVLPSGVYMYRLEVGERVAVRRLVLAK